MNWIDDNFFQILIVVWLYVLQRRIGNLSDHLLGQREMQMIADERRDQRIQLLEIALSHRPSTDT
jgi:hypothetical protein